MAPTVMSDGTPSSPAFDAREAAIDEHRWVLRRMSFDGLIRILETVHGWLVPDGSDHESLVDTIIDLEHPK